MAQHVDVITYAGEINSRGYARICTELKKKQAERALLVLATPGGDPHAGFRIARAMQHHYEAGFDALVPRYCKSAGTLILIGAASLYLDDMSELGPLDVQVKKGDELFGRSSGLDIFQAVNYLQTQAINTFNSYLMDLARAGLSTKVSSEIASRLTSGLLSPIAAQIDPIKLAEMQRATAIAFEYGTRLNEKGANLQPTGLAALVSGYPSHGFVIDRKEARAVFLRVEKPNGFFAKISDEAHAETQADINARVPMVKLATHEMQPEKLDDQHLSDPAAPSAGAAGGAASINGSLPRARTSAGKKPKRNGAEGPAA